MKITTEKKTPVKLYDWLKAKQITLKELILKKNFKSYSDLINYCNKLEMLPCSVSDFERLFFELYPPKIEIKEIEEKNEDEISLLEKEIFEKEEEEQKEITPQKQSRKKS